MKLLQEVASLEKQMSEFNSQSHSESSEEWTAEKDERRCELIDREIDGSLTAEQATELIVLQDQMLAYRRRVAPLPLDAARALHRQLLLGQSE